MHKLLIQLLYGSGLRLREGLQLRVKDVDFAQRQLVLRNTKGNESRVTVLPQTLIQPLQTHLEQGVVRWMASPPGVLVGSTVDGELL
ncbi:tyrosine-type recombinase/integrase [Nodosilinea sp. E11]|uniref:tyrosine-type recombinase/integrase n=1 Tax=Nodosilinea sp. E11 TaxID=3037479 RepID=UPI0039776A6F